jgi:hypothetical protein
MKHSKGLAPHAVTVLLVIDISVTKRLADRQKDKQTNSLTSQLAG